jgi:hypothetical protein
LKKLEGSGFVCGLQLNDTSDSREAVINCDVCVKAKATQLPFPANKKTASELLAPVHSDLLNFSKLTHSGARYIITFVNNYSRLLHVELLKKKCDAFPAFWRFLEAVERATGKKLKCLRTNNGGTYTLNEFKNYLAKCRVVHKVTIPYLPNSNGRAERINSTIVEMSMVWLAGEMKLSRSRRRNKSTRGSIFLLTSTPLPSLSPPLPAFNLFSALLPPPFFSSRPIFASHHHLTFSRPVPRFPPTLPNEPSPAPPLYSLSNNRFSPTSILAE